MDDLRHSFGDIDVYLFDQLLRGRIHPGSRLLDAGCGYGRNLVYLARRGDLHLHAVDRDPAAVDRTRRLLTELDPLDPVPDVRQAELDDLPHADGAFDVVVSCAVLHFAEDHDHFRRMLDELWRVLAPGGLLFVRLASLTGMEGRTHDLGGGRHHLPDGSTRYLVDDDRLVAETDRLGGTLLDPIKTTVVSGMRAMSTWVLRPSIT